MPVQINSHKYGQRFFGPGLGILEVDRSKVRHHIEFLDMLLSWYGANRNSNFGVAERVMI